MEITNYFSFKAALVTLFFLIFVLQSEASSLIGESGGFKYQDDLDDFDRKEAIVEDVGNGSIVIALGKSAIATIKQDAEFYKTSGAFPEAVDVLSEGLIRCIKLIATNGDDAFDLIDKYKGKQISDPEEAIGDIDKGIRMVKQKIYHSGVPALHSMGAAGVIAPGVSKTKLRQCLDPLQDSGTAVINSMDATQILATLGIKSASHSKDQGLKAAHSAIVAGISSLNASLMKGAKRAFAYLADIANKKTKEIEVTADELSARAKDVARDAETLAVIHRIDSGIKTALIEGLPSRVLNEIREGVLADIESSAKGIIAAYGAIKEARNVYITDSIKALDLIKDGFDVARQCLIDGSVQAYQGFGAAAHLIGQRKVFSAAIEIIESSRIDSTDGIEAARKLANMGLISGGLSTEKGLIAAHDAVEATEMELFTRISNAQYIALKVLKAVTKLPGLI